MKLNKIELVEIWFGNNYIPEIKGKSFRLNGHSLVCRWMTNQSKLRHFL